MKYPELNTNENAYHNEQGAFGLTKRELFSAMAMQGFIGRQDLSKNAGNNDVARICVALADALIEELNK